MILKHHHDGKVYVIEAPAGSRIHRSEAAGESVVFVPDGRGGEVPIFEEPPELIVELARAGKYGLRLLAVQERLES